MIKFRKKYFFSLKIAFILIFNLGIVFFSRINAQIIDEKDYVLGKIQLPVSESITSKYTYDPQLDLYIFSESIGDYPINFPLVLTLKEFTYSIITRI